MQKIKERTGRRALVRTCICGVMIGFSFVFCRYLGFPQSGIWRVEIGFFPIAILAMLYGPLWAGVSYGVADFIGAAIFTGVNPFITLEKVLTGVVMGLAFGGKKKLGAKRIVLAMAVVAVLLDFLMMAVIFHYAFGYAWGAAFAFRGANAGVNLVIRVLLLLLCDGRLTPIFEEKHS